MNKNAVVGMVAAGLGCLLFSCALVAARHSNVPLPVGDDGVQPTGTMIPWELILGFFGAGSWVTAIVAFLKKAQPFIDRAKDVIGPIANQTTVAPPVPVAPVPSIPQIDSRTADLVRNEIEVVAAAVYFETHKDDQGARLRYATAALQQIGLIYEGKTPVIDALRATATAIVNEQYGQPVAK